MTTPGCKRGWQRPSLAGQPCPRSITLRNQQILGTQPATAPINSLIHGGLHFRVRMLEPARFLGVDLALQNTKMQRALLGALVFSLSIPNSSQSVYSVFKTSNLFLFGQESNASWYSIYSGVGGEGRECGQVSGAVMSQTHFQLIPPFQPPPAAAAPPPPPRCLLPSQPPATCL